MDPATGGDTNNNDNDPSPTRRRDGDHPSQIVIPPAPAAASASDEILMMMNEDGTDTPILEKLMEKGAVITSVSASSSSSVTPTALPGAVSVGVGAVAVAAITGEKKGKDLLDEDTKKKNVASLLDPDDGNIINPSFLTDLQIEQQRIYTRYVEEEDDNDQGEKRQSDHDTTAVNNTGGGGSNNNSSSSSRPGQRRQSASIPGAFRESSTHNLNSSSALYTELQSEEDLHPPASSASAAAAAAAVAEATHTTNIMSSGTRESDTDAQLAVARTVLPVDEEAAVRNLPRATLEDEQGAPRPPNQQEEIKTLLYQRIAFGAICIVVLVIVIIVLVVVVLVSGNDSDNSDQQPTNNIDPPPSTTTIAPSVSIESRLWSLLPTYTQNSITKDSTTSPQALAWQWLLEDTNFSDYTVFSDQRILQRFSLATFYLASGGDQWHHNTGWLNHDWHECNWYNNNEFALKSIYSKPHILPGFMSEFNTPDGTEPPICNPEGIYQHLWLDNNNLVGGTAPIPEEFYLLTSLKTISIGLGQLQGPISSRIGQLTNLEGFLTTFPGSKGNELPSQLGLCTNMKALSLTNTGTTGTIPTQLMALTNLQTLLLGRNFLTGTLPQINPTNGWIKLKWFVVDGSQYTGTIPTQYGAMEKLEWLALGRNKLTGTIPSQLGTRSNILLLSLLKNNLSGTLTTQLGLMTSSTLLQFSSNNLSGSIPSEFGKLTNLLDTLSFANNPLMGGTTIPTELGRLTNLYTLSFANNNHIGRIPSQFGNLSGIGRLEMGNNSLTGTIPAGLGSGDKDLLFLLDIKGNPLLSGTIPEPLCNLNGTCIPKNLRLPCTETNLSFDCGIGTGRMLCGCGCSCSNSSSNNNTTTSATDDNTTIDAIDNAR